MTEHSNAFERLDKRLKDLEDDVSSILPLVKRMDADLYNHGKDGMKTKLDKFMAGEEEREKTDTRRARIHFALLGGLITLIVGLALAFFNWALSGRHFVVSHITVPTAQDASTPTDYVP